MSAPTKPTKMSGPKPVRSSDSSDKPAVDKKAAQRKAVLLAVAAIGLTALALVGGGYGLHHLVTIGAIASQTGSYLAIPVMGLGGGSGLYLLSRFKKWKETGKTSTLDKAVFITLGGLSLGLAQPLYSVAAGVAVAAGKISILEAGIIGSTTLSIPVALGLKYVVKPGLKKVGKGLSATSGLVKTVGNVIYENGKDLFSSEEESKANKVKKENKTEDKIDKKDAPDIDKKKDAPDIDEEGAPNNELESI